jgi:hypothetical protein
MIESTRYFPSNTAPRSMDLTEVTSAHGKPESTPTNQKPESLQGHKKKHMRDAVRVTTIGAKALRMRAHETSLGRQKKPEPDAPTKKMAGAAARRHCTRNEHDRPTVGLSIPYACA